MSDIEKYRLPNGKIDLFAYMKAEKEREHQEARNSAVTNGQYDWKAGAVHHKPFVRKKSKAQMKREAREAGLDTRKKKCRLCLEVEDVPRWDWPPKGSLYCCDWCRRELPMEITKPNGNHPVWWSGKIGYDLRNAYAAYWMLECEISRRLWMAKTGKQGEAIRWDLMTLEQRRAYREAPAPYMPWKE